jgi:Protein of unknown function DUF262
VFQPAVPVSKVLQGVHSRTYVLPAIQREFVWKTEQIRTLFDSLMRGYPIGAFLFWKVDPSTATQFTFYDFLTNYHEKENPYAPKIPIPAGQGVTAILDGQQRLTALNIGLYGSHAERAPRKWWTNPDAFPKKRLYIDLRDDSGVDELGMVYTLDFLTDAEAKAPAGGPDHWYPVSEVMGLTDSGPAIMAELERRKLAGTAAFNVLYRLYQAIREMPAINAFQEESQDPDKVLDIFVRVNSGGTQLSYSDLLLSMATNQWQDLDAREEVRSLVAELNGNSAGFNFSKDAVLKTGLVLVDVPDIGFKVSNFTQQNMSLMEKNWLDIRSALLTSADLLASFGYSGRTLTAASAIIPIAYYLHQRGLGTSYVEASAHAQDRLADQGWLTRSLMKRGVWGSGLDTLLSRIREAIREHGSQGFPTEAIEAAMALAGKSLRFEKAEIAELLELRFGSARVFPVLATLYPGLDLTKSFHEDHIFPRSRFTRAKLAKAGIAPDRIEEYFAKADALPNLQLLAGLPNVEKQTMLPAAWLDGPHFPTSAARSTYITENDLQDLPVDLNGFLEFYDARRQRIETRLKRALNVESTEMSITSA